MKPLKLSVLLLAATLVSTSHAGAAAPKLLHYQTKVLDSNGQPLAGVTVERYRLPGFWASADSSLRLEESTTSDSTGTVSFTATNHAVFMLFARKPGLALAWNVWLPGFPGAELSGEGSDLVLAAAASVSGIVQDAAGKPIPDAPVWVSSATRGGNQQSWIPLSSKLGREFLAARTGPDGRFRIEGLPVEASFDLTAAKLGLALDQPPHTPFGMANLSFQAGQTNIVLTLKPAGTIEGRVVQANSGVPIAGARVVLAENAWNDNIESAPTGSDGRFLLADLAPFEYKLHAVIGTNPFTDWVCDDVSVTVEARATNRDVKFAASRGGVLEVALRDPAGHPATDATVGVSHDSSGQMAPISEDGIARFRLAPGDYQLFAFCEGYKGHQAQATVEQDQTNHLDFDLELGTKVAGVVLRPDGKPAANIKVSLFPFSPAEKQTDAEGRFTLTPNQLGDTEEQGGCVIARDLPHNLAAAVDLEGDKTNLTLRLEPALTLAGRVTDEKGKAITNSHAQAMFRTEHMSSSLGAPVSADAQGRFELKGLPPSRAYTVTASAKGFGQNNRELEAGETGTNRLQLDPLQLPTADRRIAGRVVTADEKPVAGAWVNGNGEHQPALSGHSDAQGRFSFDQVCAGQINLSANDMHGGYGGVTAEAGDTNITIQFGVSRAFPGAGGSSKLTGTVTDAEAKPAPKVTVALFPFHGADSQTDAEGRFKLSFNREQSGGPEGTPHVLIARDFARNLATAQEVEPDATNAALKLEPALTLAGSITDTNGTPLPNAEAQVMFQTERMGSSLGTPLRADAAGRFEIKTLPPGSRFSVNVSAKGYGRESRRVEPAEAESRRVQLEPFKLVVADRRIAGVVLDADDKPVARASLYCYEDKQPNLNGQTDAKGRFSFDHVCAGPIRLSANSPRGGYANVTTEGGDTNIVIRMDTPSNPGGEAPRLARLKGKPLPDLAPLGLAPADAPVDQAILAVLIDAEQRPSRRLLRLLGEQAADLKQKRLIVVVLQAGGMADDAFATWKQDAALPFAAGCLKGDAEKARAAWGAGALPWLILTDKAHRVTAEGFALEELEAKLSPAPK